MASSHELASPLSKKKKEKESGHGWGEGLGRGRLVIKKKNTTTVFSDQDQRRKGNGGFHIDKKRRKGDFKKRQRKIFGITSRSSRRGQTPPMQGRKRRLEREEHAGTTCQ